MASNRNRRTEKTRNLFKRCIKKSLAKPENITVSQWAQKYRLLNESSALPGRWHNEITPYLVGIMDCFTNPNIHFINFVKSSQVGGTEALINATGWITTMSPAPTMIVYPTDELAKRISNDRLQPVYKNTPIIAERFRNTKSSATNLKFRGMNLYLVSGGSVAKVSSTSIKYLFFDEIDKMGGASKKEASPYNLAVERTKTFTHTRKIYTCSTPTIRENYVWQLHQKADEQRQFFVPCPHCGEFITLEWESIRMEKNNDGKLTNRERADTAVYVCKECGGLIYDADKPSMLQKGEWRNVKETSPEKVTSVSFHLNALYSFFLKWSDIAYEYLESREDPEMYQNFVNSWLGRPWEDSKLRVYAELVLERQAEEPAGIVPDWAKMLTAGVDVQENCVYFDIVAWGDKLTSQSIMHGQLLSLNDLEKYMNAEYSTKNGERFMVDLCLIDSGDQTDDIYDFCYRHSDWAIACKGIAGGYNHYRISKINRKGAEYDGQNLILVDGGKYKDSIASRLRKPNGVGSCMVHAECDLDYAEQLSAEQKVAEGQGARRKVVWRKKTPYAANHYLDCRVYAYAAADVEGVRTFGMDDVQAPVQSNEKKTNGWLNGYK